MKPDARDALHGTFTQRLPVRALQFLRAEKAVSDEVLEEHGVKDSTIRHLAEAFRHPEFYELSQVIYAALENVIRQHDPIDDTDYNELFEIIDPHFRGKDNPVLSLVIATLRSLQITISGVHE